MLRLPTFLCAGLLILLAAGCLPTRPAASANGREQGGKSAGKEHGKAHAGKKEVKHDKAAAKAELPRWKFLHFYPLPDVPEPSGLCFVPEQHAMFVVDDGDIPSKRPCRLCKLDLDCRLLAALELGKDLEGVCWCSELKRLVVADEINENFYLVDPQTMKQTGSFHLEHKIAGHSVFKTGGNGFEGIEYLPAAQTGLAGELLALNQDDPTGIAVINVSSIDPGLAEQKISAARMVELDQINAGEIRYYPQEDELWVVHSWMNITEILDPKTLALRRWEVMPGSAQEGVAFDERGRMWVGQDTGGIALYERLPES